MATATKKVTKGFKHRCPLCGAEESLSVKLEDVHALTCGECSEDIDADDVRAIIAQWQALLTWLDSAPPVG